MAFINEFAVIKMLIQKVFITSEDNTPVYRDESRNSWSLQTSSSSTWSQRFAPLKKNKKKKKTHPKQQKTETVTNP